MEIPIRYKGKTYQADLSKPIEISIPLREGPGNVNCFYAPPAEYSPVVSGDFIGSRAKGGPVNFLNVKFNPHGNGTHTECVGHIAKESYTINQCLKKFHFLCKLVSVFPTKTDDSDRVILKNQLEDILKGEATEALAIRTLPNDDLKMRTNYSGANPPYLDPEAATYLVELGVRHLLVDLPSVDREEDGGALRAHRAFWQYPDNVRENCTISELIYANNDIKDGLYLLNIQIANFEMDASPSMPVLYELG